MINNNFIEILGQKFDIDSIEVSNYRIDESNFIVISCDVRCHSKNMDLILYNVDAEFAKNLSKLIIP